MARRISIGISIFGGGGGGSPPPPPPPPPVRLVLDLPADGGGAGGSHEGSFREVKITPKGAAERGVFFPLTRSEKSSIESVRCASGAPYTPVSTITYSSVERSPCEVGTEWPM